MSTSLICRTILIGTAALMTLCGLSPLPAVADEQIVLPFECNVVGGRVQMRPSSDQAYRIYGTRQEQRYRACSERNPDRCRTFLVHRFTMACGRDRVAWPEAYEAIARATDGRAFFNPDGALYYRMGPREGREGYPFPERRHVTGVVELPDGFAPLAGVDAIFTPLDPRVAELEDGSPPRNGGSDRQSTFEPALTSKPATEPVAKKEPGPVQQPAPQSAPKPLETASTTKPDAADRRLAERLAEASGAAQRSEQKAAAPEPAAPPAAAAAPASPSPVAPTILNNPAAKEVEQASKTETVVAAAEMTPPPQTQPSAQTGPRVEGWSASGGSGRISVPPIAFAILIAAATLAILVVILKKQAEAPVAAGPVRVPIEPVLPGFDPPRPQGQSLVLRENPEPPVLGSTVSQTPGVPSTRADALALLGLNADATDPVIRKLVEALRQSWHPDLAATPEDRAAREERIKAINVAADLLLRKPAA
jgi:hypothetical protein